MSEEINSEEFPKKLLEFKTLLNPTRLAIMAIVFQRYQVPASEVRRFLGIPWGTFNSHLKVLVKAGYISLKRAFINNSPMVVCYLEKEGSEKFKELMKTWKELKGFSS